MTYVTNPVSAHARYALMYSHLAVWAAKHRPFREMAKRCRRQAKQHLKDARRVRAELEAA